MHTCASYVMITLSMMESQSQWYPIYGDVKDTVPDAELVLA